MGGFQRHWERHAPQQHNTVSCRCLHWTPGVRSDDQSQDLRFWKCMSLGFVRGPPTAPDRRGKRTHLRKGRQFSGFLLLLSLCLELDAAGRVAQQCTGMTNCGHLGVAERGSEGTGAVLRLQTLRLRGGAKDALTSTKRKGRYRGAQRAARKGAKVATAQLGVLNSKGFDARDDTAFDIKKSIPKKARGMMEDGPAISLGVKKEGGGDRAGRDASETDKNSDEDSDQRRARKRIALNERKLLKKKTAAKQTATHDEEKNTRQEMVAANQKEDLWASSSSEGGDVDIDANFIIPQPDPAPAAPAAPPLSSLASLREQLFYNKRLQRAVIDGNLSACEEAVRSGAWPDWRDPSMSRMAPLHIAALNGSEAMITHLWAAGADANLRDARGLAPLHIAVMEAHDTAALELARLGARVHLRQKLAARRRTPLELVRWREELEEGMEKVLAQRAAKREAERERREREGGGDGEEAGAREAGGKGISEKERERRRRIAMEKSDVDERVEDEPGDEEEQGVWEGFDAGREIREMCVRIAQSGSGKEEIFAMGMPDEVPGDGPSASDSFEPEFSE